MACVRGLAPNHKPGVGGDRLRRRFRGVVKFEVPFMVAQVCGFAVLRLGLKGSGLIELGAVALRGLSVWGSAFGGCSKGAGG